MSTYGQHITFGPFFSGGSLCTLKVYHYASGTTTLKDVYTDREKLTTAAQPLLSDSNGVAFCFADGLYKFRIDISTDGVNYSTLYTEDKWAVVDQSLNLSGEGTAITSAATLTLGTDGDFFHVTGSTGPITAISGTQLRVTLVFDSTPTLTHSGNLILVNAVSTTVAANTVISFLNEGAGVWREESRSAAQTDAAFRVYGSSDATKVLALEVDSLTTATTRTGFVTDENMSLGQSWDVKNISLVASVAANALTVALKTKNGTDPSATDPIIFKFRNATVATGDYTTVALTTAASLVVSSGSTLGTTSTIAYRYYIGMANDAGTLRLFIYNPYVWLTSSLAGVVDDLVYSSTAEGGAGAADSAQVLYSGTAFTNKSVRILGYIEATQTIAGTWATSPSKIQLMGPGVKRTGDRVQVQNVSSGAMATGTTALPDDDTIPQITEGDEYLSKAVTPTSAVNLLEISALLNMAHSAAPLFVGIALFQDATAGALAATRTNLGDNAQMSQGALSHTMQAGTVASTTLRIRAGSSTGATLTLNGIAGARKYGGVLVSMMSVEEIFV